MFVYRTPRSKAFCLLGMYSPSKVPPPAQKRAKGGWWGSSTSQPLLITQDLARMVIRPLGLARQNVINLIQQVDAFSHHNFDWSCLSVAHDS